METPLIEFQKVSKRFGNQVILNEADLRIYRGEVTTVIGKSGVGKSVLLKHIIGLMEPDSGQILFEGHPVSKMTKQERKSLKRKFSYMFQNTALFDSMTVYENIALPLKETTRLEDKEVRRRVLDMMERVDLHDIEYKYPSQLSGGMKKRVALARALVTDPDTVLFDEPTTGLDPIRKNAVHSMISDYQRRFGFTGIVVSHEIPDVFYISQRVAMLQNGRIVFQGSPGEIDQVSDPEVRAFVHGLEAPHDGLTGMGTRLQGEHRFDEEMGRLQRHGTAFSVLLFTLDDLDEINEKAGYHTGQSVVRAFADALKVRVRISDLCCRYGVNKIIAVLPETGRDQARQACARLAAEISAEKLLDVDPYPECRFSVYAGFAEARADEPLEQVLIRAESRKNVLYDFQVSPMEES
ncbi:MAG: ATP-binding cassette domain-containing protein [Deltaproteobacteria bacterium]|nr:ATP-binding cassette domain-containing protein [Deltaproteobacteria bacterium]